MKNIICTYCRDTHQDIFFKVHPCPFCSEGKPRGSDYSPEYLSKTLEEHEANEPAEEDETSEEYEKWQLRKLIKKYYSEAKIMMKDCLQ